MSFGGQKAGVNAQISSLLGTISNLRILSLEGLLHRTKVLTVVRQPQVKKQGLTVTVFLSELVFGSMIINLKGHLSTHAK